MKTPKGANGALPPGIGLGWPPSSSSAWAGRGDKTPAPTTAPAAATFPKNARREARRPWTYVIFIGVSSCDVNRMDRSVIGIRRTGNRGEVAPRDSTVIALDHSSKRSGVDGLRTGSVHGEG